MQLRNGHRHPTMSAPKSDLASTRLIYNMQTMFTKILDTPITSKRNLQVSGMLAGDLDNH